MKQTTIQFLSTIGLLLAAQFSFAQVELRWDAHGIGFSCPATFKVDSNDGEEFSASNDNIFLSITPFQDENLTEEGLAQALVAMAEELGYDKVDKVASTELHDFTGFYVLGTKDGVHALLMALMDTESSTNLLVSIVYPDKGEREALKIANSFFAYD